MTPSRPRRFWLRQLAPGLGAASLAAMLAAPLGMASCASGSRAGLGPEASLASSAEAQAQFRALREQWINTAPDARVGLERACTSFIQRFPEDPQGRWVRIYLAWIALSRADLPLAERWLSLADAGPYGSASDLSEVVRAAIDLAAGRAPTAYAKLFALEGRLIDPDDRLLCLDRLVLASLAVERYEDALQQMLELAAVAARRHRERLWRSLEPRLSEVPLPVLEATLPRLSASAIESPSVRPAERAAAVDWMRQQILQVLARSAIQHQDVALAQRLVSSSPLAGNSLGAGASGGAAGGSGTGPASPGGVPARSELLWLATQGSLTPTVRGRTLGLALELGDAVTRQRSLDVASGIALTLELAQRSPGGAHPALETRPVDGGALSDTLARLAGDGAALLVAGFDPHGAAVAAQFAAERAMPVLLLEAPEGGPQALSRFAYLVGDDSEALGQLLRSALQPRVDTLLSVGTATAQCSESGATLPPELGRAQSERRPGLLLLGGVECEDLAEQLDSRWVLGLGLGALSMARTLAREHETWWLVTGRMLELESRRDGAAGSWFEKKGRAPGWYEALGHDIARIADAVLPPAPESPLRDPARVAEVHQQILTRLGALQQPELWTSSEGSFQSQRLQRQWRAQRVER